MENANKQIIPFLKWAGGKRQLLNEIRKHLPEINKEATYFEPFLGGGAHLFDLQPTKAIVSDTSSELINCYKVIKKDPQGLIKELKKHKNQEDYYYSVREWDREPNYKEKRTAIERAARIIFLNKTCYNGLFRINSKGHFNVPFGRYSNPDIVNKDVILSIHEYLKSNDIDILVSDFEKTLEKAKRGDFVYLDPPYDPLSETSSFTSYSEKFGKNEQERLFKACKELTKKGCKFMLSNSDTPFIRNLYRDKKTTIITVMAKRSLNSKAEKRGKIKEVLILNY